jgi:hypothetical protein
MEFRVGFAEAACVYGYSIDEAKGKERPRNAPYGEHPVYHLLFFLPGDRMGCVVRPRSFFENVGIPGARFSFRARYYPLGISDCLDFPGHILNGA